MRITVITPVLNARHYIQDTINSVRHQTHPNVEHIVIDGGSTDGTLDVLNRYENDLAHFESKADSSMYEALNRGLSRATGELIGFLNGDDFLAGPHVLERMGALANKHLDRDGFFGDLIKFSAKAAWIRLGVSCTFEELLSAGSGTLVPHPTLMVRRNFAERVGPYDERFKYAGDYDYVLRCLRLGTIAYARFPVTCFRIHANSITASGRLREDTEAVKKVHSVGEMSRLRRLSLGVRAWGRFTRKNWYPQIRRRWARRRFVAGELRWWTAD